jgi:hypothetical protein
MSFHRHEKGIEMRKNLYTIAACAALAVTASNANADPIPSGGLYISIWDQNSNTSFLANLGVTAADFLANNVNGQTNFSLAGTALSALDSWLDSLTDRSSIVWSIQGTLPGTTPPKGGLTTVKDISALNLSFTVTDPAFNAVNQFATQHNGDLVASNGFAYAGVEFIQDFGSAAIGFNSDGLLNETLSFYQLIGGTRSAAGQFVELAGTFTLSYLNGAASLMFTAVPIPAAVWLLCSGLLGLAGVARRSRA